MGWLRLVGFLKWWVSFAKEPHKRDHILQKRPIILRSLLIVATPYQQGNRKNGLGRADTIVWNSSYIWNTSKEFILYTSMEYTCYSRACIWMSRKLRKFCHVYYTSAQADVWIYVWVCVMHKYSWKCVNIYMSMCTTWILKEMYEFIYEYVSHANTLVNVWECIWVCVLHQYSSKCMNVDMKMCSTPILK